MKITAKFLMDSEYPACSQQMEIFDRVFPNGMELTYDNFELAKNEGLMLGWFIPHKMPYKLHDMIIKIMETSTSFMKEATYLLFDAESNEQSDLLKLSANSQMSIDDYDCRYNAIVEKYKIKRAKIRDAYAEAMHYVGFEMLVAYGNDDGSIKSTKPITIYLSDLINQKSSACEEHARRFASAFPYGMELTVDNLCKAKSNNLDIMWFIAKKLPQKIYSATTHFGNLMLIQRSALRDLMHNKLLDKCEKHRLFYLNLLEKETNGEEKNQLYIEWKESDETAEAEYHKERRGLIDFQEFSVCLLALHLTNIYGLELL